MWPAERRAEWQGGPLELTSTEFNLLEVLAARRRSPVTKRELSNRRCRGRWRASTAASTCTCRDPPQAGRLADGRSVIQTVRGLGYQLIRE